MTDNARIEGADRAGEQSPAKREDIVRQIHSEAEASADLLCALRAVMVSQADDALDHALVAGTIEGETNLYELIDKAVIECAELKAQTAALADLIRQFRARKARMEEREQTIRTALAVALEAIHQEGSLRRPAATMWLNKPKIDVEIDEEQESNIPDAYWDVIQPEPVVKLKTNDLIDDLQSGKVTIAGCRLVERPRTVTIKGS